jgi:LppP/LprE lipoprotein
MRRVIRFRSRVLPSAVILWLLTATAASAQDVRASSWLDRPLVNWNKPGATLPPPPADAEAKQEAMKRCQLTPPLATAAEKAVDAAGWVPFWNVDQQLVRDGVEIVGGMSAADGMCRPAQYNLFAFVDGRFAGALSPTPMTSRLDGSSGAVRMPLPLLTAEFARYTPSDPLCCPSSRVTVRYRIDRTPAGPVVAPVDVRTTRP